MRLKWRLHLDEDGRLSNEKGEPLASPKILAGSQPELDVQIWAIDSNGAFAKHAISGAAGSSAKLVIEKPKDFAASDALDRASEYALTLDANNGFKNTVDFSDAGLLAIMPQDTQKGVQTVETFARVEVTLAGGEVLVSRFPVKIAEKYTTP